MTKILHFQRAIRQGSHVLIALWGFSGSGKTLSALKLARGLAGKDGKIALIDTETGRALIYAKVAEPWDHAELTPPFSPDRYIDAITDAEAGGYDVVIIDSFSHCWNSIGGVLEMAEENPKLRGLLKWAAPKAKYKRLVQTMLRARCHIIVCLRAKEKMRQEGDKVFSDGFVPIQEKNGVPKLDKCPEDLLPAFPPGEQISERTGERIRAWLDGAVPVDRAFEQAKRNAEDRADNGTVALRDFWYSLDKQLQRQLKPQMENLKSIAAEADRRAAEEYGEVTREEAPPLDDAPTAPPAAPPHDERLDDPFGLPPLPKTAAVAAAPVVKRETRPQPAKIGGRRVAK